MPFMLTQLIRSSSYSYQWLYSTNEPLTFRKLLEFTVFRHGVNKTSIMRNLELSFDIHIANMVVSNDLKGLDMAGLYFIL